MPNPNVDVIIGGNQMFSKTFFGLPNSCEIEYITLFLKLIIVVIFYFILIISITIIVYLPNIKSYLSFFINYMN